MGPLRLREMTVTTRLFEMTDILVGLRAGERGLLFSFQPGSNSLNHCTLFSTFSDASLRIEQTTKPLKLGLPTSGVLWAVLVKYVETQDNVGKMCKTFRDCGDDIMTLSVQEKCK